MRKKLSVIFIIAGAVLLLSALGLFLYNAAESARAASAASEVLEKLAEEDEEGSGESGGFFDVNTDPLSVKEVDGIGYIGTLVIPDINLELPIAQVYTDDNLRISPCVYSGSPLSDDLVICGHNSSHFGSLRQMSVAGASDASGEDSASVSSAGSFVYFNSFDGRTWVYELVNIETVWPTDIAGVTDTPYDLVLFTCTYDARARLSFGCVRISDALVSE